MEVNIRELLEGLEDSSVPMNDENVVSATRIKELTSMKIEPRNHKPQKGTRKRIITFALAAALVLSMSVAVYAVGEIFEYRKIEGDSNLSKQSEQGAEDIKSFCFGEYELIPCDEALYLDNDKGQSGVTDFEYTVKGSGERVGVSYYDSGEIYCMDARNLFPLDYTPHQFPFDYLEEKYPDREAYRLKLVEAAPGCIDRLHDEGWIKHSSEDIFKADILPIHVFAETYAEIRVLMNDDTGYELWLEPESFELEGFMYYNVEDTKLMRNGFFPALKEDRLEEWWAELTANSVG